MAALFLALFAWASALLPRQQAPAFKVSVVSNEKFETRTLEDFAGKYLVLLFYPFDFTFVCPTEILSFSENM